MENKAEILDCLRMARDLISDEEAWTQNAEFRDERGRACCIDDAVKCCAIGATDMAMERLHDKSPGSYSIHLDCQADRELARTIAQVDASLSQLSVWDVVPNFNDTHSHAEVLELFDKTIVRLQESDD